MYTNIAKFHSLMQLFICIIARVIEARGYDLLFHLVAPRRAVCLCYDGLVLLAAGVLCDGLGALTNCVFSELSR